MSDEQLAEVWKIYQSAADLPFPERRLFVESSSSDPLIVGEVMDLLAQSDDKVEGDSDSLKAPPPVTIGTYQITGTLGRGGTGIVYSARDSVLGRAVALKLLTPGVDTGRHLREARMASSLNHPNIVSIYQVVETGNRKAIVMELIAGSALRSLCGQPISTTSLCRIGAQAAQALAAAHSQGLIHRDIKPENIMVRPDGYVKVLDFGLARDLTEDSRSSHTGIPTGTLRYMSPQQTLGQKLTAATDVFSLGIVLYELAARRHPFEAGSALESAHAIATGTVMRPSTVDAGIHPRLEALILAMLAKDPASRPTAESVAAELSSIERSEAAPAGPPRAPVQAGSRRRFAMLGALAAVAVAGIAAIAWTLWDHQSKPLPPMVPDESKLVHAARADDPIPARHFFGITPEGAVLAYRDNSGDDGGPASWVAQSVAVPTLSGADFTKFQTVVGGGDGVLYGIGKDRSVTYFRILDPWRNKGPMSWSADSNRVIGSLSRDYVSVSGLSRPVWLSVPRSGSSEVIEHPPWNTGLIRGGDLFAVDRDGRTSLYHHGWIEGGNPGTLDEVSHWIARPHRGYIAPFWQPPVLPPSDPCKRCLLYEGGQGIVYALTPDGVLSRYRQRPGGDWVEPRGKSQVGPHGAEVGHGWEMFRDVIVEPSDYSIEGYVLASATPGEPPSMSVLPGQKVSVRVSTFSPAYTVRLLRLQRSQDSASPSGLIDGWPVGPARRVDAPQGGNFKKSESLAMAHSGAQWPGDGVEFDLPRNAPSGIYAAELTTPSGGRSLAPFVVRGVAGSGRTIALIANAITWNALNQWGGGSREVSFRETVAGEPYQLSFERPLLDTPWYGGVSASSGLTNRQERAFNQSVRAEVWIASLLDVFARRDPKYSYDAFTDLDLNAGNFDPSQYRVLILQTLPRYWTIAMRDRLDKFLASGGHLIYLGSGGLAEQVTLSSGGRLEFRNGPGSGCVVSSNPKNADRISAECPALDLFRWPSPQHPDGRSERAVLGVAQEILADPVRLGPGGIPFLLWKAHPFLAGFEKDEAMSEVRGINGNLRMADGESNGAYTPGFCADLPGGQCTATHSTLAGVVLAYSSLRPSPVAPIAPSNIVFRKTESGGWVFSIGSLSVGGVLVVDPAIQRVLSTALDSALEK